MENIPVLPTLQSDEQIADFIATRMERAADLREQGLNAECEVLLASAYEMAVEADDPDALGFLYAVFSPTEQ
jgi:hypothetical protein